MFEKWRSLRGLALLTVLLLALAPWLVATARADHGPAHSAVAQIKVEVVDGGFNGVTGKFSGTTSEDFTIEVEQGQLVELTIVFAQTADLDDEHIMVLKGYNLETDRISYHNRETTIKFVADKPGTFEFACDLDCKIHDRLKSGHLKVSRSAPSAAAPTATGAPTAAAPSAAAAAIARTSLSLTPSAWEVVGGPVDLTASLKDAQGAPVAKAEVTFFAEAELAGTKGLMEIGIAKTDKEGVARIDYTPTVAGEQRVVARFEGMGLYGESEQAIQIRELAPQPAYSVAPTGLSGLRDWAPLGVVLVLASVWGTFAYVLYNIYRIGRARG